MNKRPANAASVRFRRFSTAVTAIVAIATGLCVLSACAQPPREKGAVTLDSVPGGTYRFAGMVGDRVRANIDGWLTVAPRNNPGLLDMFARRDAGPAPDLVPWAGEFVGKYLISGVQALRMSDDPELKQALAGIVDRLLQLQADDGYLGPWPKHERLRGHWDLWGHYHILLALLMWYEQTDDPRALEAARRIGDLVCNTFLDSPLRVIDAGSHEMNMAILHGLGRLYRETNEPRYLRMANEVVKDFENAGDYYRQGLQGREFYRTPRPRWESLHCLQGLVEMYRITGDDSYRTAFLHHWASIRRFDLRNTGGFSSGEQATGNPFANHAIETCCVVAWQEVMMDALRLTGDSTIADDLESSTLNAMLGAQHPSGGWCTYNTPMAGRRISSHVDIRFQARPDTPHLNCCSVNGPRGYGSLCHWAVMQGQRRVVINYFGPMQATLPRTDVAALKIQQDTSYPRDGVIRITLQPVQPRRFTLALRIPAWSETSWVRVAGGPQQPAPPGRYLEIDRTWQPGDAVTLNLDMRLRFLVGDLDQHGRVSLYRGPLLLAADSRLVEGEPAAVDLDCLDRAQVVSQDESNALDPHDHAAWIVVDVPTVPQGTLRLIDFASAGATTVEGQPISDYRTWLAAQPLPPPRPVAWKPADGEVVGSGAIRFVWRSPAANDIDVRRHAVVISESPGFDEIALQYGDQTGGWLVVPAEKTAPLKPLTPYYWKIVARNPNGTSESLTPWKRFTMDPQAPPLANNWPYGQRESDQMIVAAPLDGEVKPSYGALLDDRGWKPATGLNEVPRGAIETDGKSGLVRYRLLSFPEKQYSLSIWVNALAPAKTQYGQIFSAWTAGMDDPLRVFLTGTRLAARIEAGKFYDTQAVPIEIGRWYHVAAVKDGARLTLYLDGESRSTVEVPERVNSTAVDFALGGNPHFHGPEFLAARLADLRFYARSLSPAEVRKIYHNPGPGRQ